MEPTSQLQIFGPTRTAIVGAGFIADFHLDILADLKDVSIVAICDADLERARSAAKRHGVAEAVASLEELVDLNVQVVHLCLPPDLHARLARRALELGMGVFCEKPLVLDSEEASKLGQLAAEKGLPLSANHNSLHHPAYKRIKRRLQAGEIGRVEHVQVTLSVPLRQLDAGDFSHWMFREPRNILFEQAVHPFAQLVDLIGAVQSVDVSLLGTRELVPGHPFHDRWLIAAKAERGTAEIYLAFGQAFTRNTIQVIGTDGSLQADLFHDTSEGERKTYWLDFWNSFLAGWRRGSETRKTARKVLSNYLRQTLGLIQREDAFFAGMRDSMTAFHLALREEREPASGADEAREVLRWCETCAAQIPPFLPSKWAPPELGPTRAGEVLVIGGTGFIGRRVIAGLLEKGLPVTALVRRSHNLPPEVVAGADSGRLRLVTGRLEDTDSLRNAIRGCKVVMQLATGGGSRWEDFERGMIGGTRAVAELCLELEVERLVYVSSTAALYLGRDVGSAPLEDNLRPDPQPEGRALYAKGKIACEELLFDMRREQGLPVVIARPGVVLGHGTPMQHSGIGLWVRDNHCVGWGLGNNHLPLVLADDVADALVQMAAFVGTELDGKALNLCARVPLNARQLVDAMREQTGRDLHFHPRELPFSQLLEIGKWIVKQVGGRRDAPFPSWRDLKSRELFPPFTARTAREKLNWKPVEDPDQFLSLAFGEAPTPSPPQAPEPEAPSPKRDSDSVRATRKAPSA